jgi:uncharacterized repeat protein (TIGR03803 family)
MAEQGGTNGNGTIFSINTNGTGFTVLHTFTANPTNLSGVHTNSDGANPYDGLLLLGTNLYGVAQKGGTNGNGTVFAINTNGSVFTTLHSFTANSDGSLPGAVLVVSGSALYGEALGGGSQGAGTVFAINTDGTGFANLHSFTNSDGFNPIAGLVLSGNTLYGTAFGGGASGLGSVFAVNTDGSGFRNVHSFTNGTDGAFPQCVLLLSGNTLYGTALNGGSSGHGTLFAVNTDGSGFTTLHSFTATSGPHSTNSDGSGPGVGLVLSGNTLYGTAGGGGTNGAGTVFSLTLPVQLAINLSGTNVILTWPTYAAGFTLQSTNNLISPTVWPDVSPAPVVVNGRYTVTNPISGTQQFYRLSQ